MCLKRGWSHDRQKRPRWEGGIVLLSLVGLQLRKKGEEKEEAEQEEEEEEEKEEEKEEHREEEKQNTEKNDRQHQDYIPF